MLGKLLTLPNNATLIVRLAADTRRRLPSKLEFRPNVRLLHTCLHQLSLNHINVPDSPNCLKMQHARLLKSVKSGLLLRRVRRKETNRKKKKKKRKEKRCHLFSRIKWHPQIRFTPFNPRIVSSTLPYCATFTHSVTKMNVYQLAQRSALPLTSTHSA